jgi:glyoxylase-like metal-dependent hydrolase (beta-lactamase superfamily II)
MTVIANDNRIRIEKLQLGPWGTNCYIVVCPATRDSLVVDAPANAEEIIARLDNTNPRFILLTHGHMDHTGALNNLRTRLKVPLAAHAQDSSSLVPPPALLLNDGDKVTLGKLELEVLHTPGHTPSGLCFKTAHYLFSGDTLFPGGPGRTSSPDSFRQLIGSLESKIFTLPGDTSILPGHGETTQLEKELEEFRVFSSREHHPDLCGDVLWLKS